MKGLVRSDNIFSILFSLVFTSNIYGAEVVNKDLSDLKISYRSEGTYSPYKYIEVELYGSGEGKLSYEFYREYVPKGEEEEKTIAFKVDQSILQEFVHLHEKVDFFNLEVADLNKDEIRVTDVGTTTLTYSHKGMARTISYGYVENNPLAELIQLYWQLLRFA